MPMSSGRQRSHHRDRLLDVLAALARVAELQEESDLDAMRPEQAAGVLDLLDACALFHGIQNSLRARLGADPGGAAPGRCERACDRLGHAVRAQQALERHDGAMRDLQVGKAFDPARLQAEDVVGNPQVIGLEAGTAATRSPPPRLPARAPCSAGRKSASRTSCSDTDSRGSWPRSSRNSRGGEARRRDSARCPPGPRRAAGEHRDRE